MSIPLPPLPEPDSRWHPSWGIPSTYSADQMHAHAAAVSADKDTEIAQLREYLDAAQRRGEELRAENERLIDLLDACSSEEGPDQTDINRARTAIDAARVAQGDGNG